MKQTRWGILGPGSIAQNFADGLAQAPSGILTAIASTSADRRASFGDRNKVKPEKRHASYDALLADADVDAVYISTPHPWHAEWAIKAMRAGKAVLVEKPAGMNAAEVVASRKWPNNAVHFLWKPICIAAIRKLPACWKSLRLVRSEN